MEISQLLLITDNPGLSGLIWLVLLMVVMYLGREPAKRSIRAAMRIIYSGLRFWRRPCSAQKNVWCSGIKKCCSPPGAKRKNAS